MMNCFVFEIAASAQPHDCAWGEEDLERNEPKPQNKNWGIAVDRDANYSSYQNLPKLVSLTLV